MFNNYIWIKTKTYVFDKKQEDDFEYYPLNFLKLTLKIMALKIGKCLNVIC